MGSGISAAVLILLMVIFVVVEVALKFQTIFQLFKEEQILWEDLDETMPVMRCFLSSLENPLQLLYSVLSILALIGCIHLSCSQHELLDEGAAVQLYRFCAGVSSFYGSHI